MKLYSQSLELKALRTIAYANGESDSGVAKVETDSRALASAQVLSSVDLSFFQYEPCRAAFSRILRVAEKRSRIMDYESLLEDSTISEEFRDVLREEKKKPAKTEREAEELVVHLDNYRKTRIAYETAKLTLEALKESKVDADELLNAMTGKIAEARSRENTQDKILNLGSEGNAYKLIDRVLDPTTETLHKTGFSEFDERNGGLPAEGVFILAGTTSGGKSVLRMNIMDYMYRHNNLDSLTVSLEMNPEKEARRLASSVSKVPLWKIAKGMLTPADRTKIKKSWKEFYRHGKDNNCRYSLYCPTRALSIQQLLMLVKPYKHKVIALDYVSLLEGVDEKDQWKMLSSIVRQCKIFSAENKCLFIVLAQLDSEDDRIRYSKGMLEHADACWTWNYSKPEQRELRELPIVQRKARDQELFPFTLRERFDIMRVMNPNDPDATAGEPQNSGSARRDDEARYGDEDDDNESSKSVKGSGKSKKSGGSKRRSSSDEDNIQFAVD